MIKIDNKIYNTLRVVAAICFIGLGAIAILFCYNVGPFGIKKPKGIDTAVYNYKTFKQRDSSCGDNLDSTCTIVKITYPDFGNKKALNDSVIRKFADLFASTKNRSITDYKQLAINFIDGYRDFKNIQPRSTLIYLLEGHAKVLRQDSDVLTVEVDGYTYQGGPHGIEYTAYVNWNIKTNKSIGLKDILVKGYQDSLNKVAEQIFRKKEKLRDTSSLNDQRNYFFANNKFQLPNNCLITPLGIRFLYNVYTIKAYDAGATKLFIPYTQIQSLLSPASVVTQYLNVE